MFLLKKLLKAFPHQGDSVAYERTEEILTPITFNEYHSLKINHP